MARKVPKCRLTLVPICVVPSNTFTVLLASAEPLSTATWEAASADEDVDMTSVGATGATLSTTTVLTVEAGLVPVDVVAVAENLWLPSVKEPLVKLQWLSLIHISEPTRPY